MEHIENLSLKQLEQLIETATAEWILRSRNSGKGSIIMYDGTVVSLLNFKPEDYNPEHCFNILPNINRYNGNTYIPFSVGQHSLLCYEIAQLLYGKENKITQFCSLVHDFPEAVLGDCISPIKHLFPMLLFRTLEQNVNESMLSSLGITSLWTKDEVKLVDKIALSIEAYNLNKYSEFEVWENYIFTDFELNKLFKDNASEFDSTLFNKVANLQPRQVEVLLRNTYYKLLGDVKKEIT